MTSIYLAKTTNQKKEMTDGLIDRFAFKIFFPQISMNTFHKTTQYLVNMVLAKNYIDLKTNNWIYLDSQVADASVHKLSNLLCQRLKQSNYDNRKLLQTLKLAIHNGKNYSNKSQYQKQESNPQNEKKQKSKLLWYMR